MDPKVTAREHRRRQAASGDWGAAATLILEHGTEGLSDEVDHLIARSRSIPPQERLAFAEGEVLALRVRMDAMQAIVRDVLGRSPSRLDALRPVMTALAREPARLGTLEAELTGARPADRDSPAWIGHLQALAGAGGGS